MDEPLTDQHKAIVDLGANRYLAHQTIFASKHPQQTPQFHYDIMRLWSSEHPHALVMAFRGAAKSTLAEQAITLAACYREFKNCVILGDTWTRAVERLQKIRNEFETNVLLEGLFGSLVGPTWTDDKLVLANGCVIQALGRGQSMRGTKYLDDRPDLCFLDDIEDAESCMSDAAIDKTMRWLMGEVVPAMAPGYRMRLNGTPLHPKSVLMQLYNDDGWQSLRIPIEYIDADGERHSAWPQRFPLADIDRRKASYARLGLTTQYMQEYMCEAEDIAGKPFERSMLKVEPRVRTWESVYVVYDPARTTNKTSATTGKVVYSWIGNRLHVWDATGSFWKPDELVSDLFATAVTYQPIAVYIEADGLNEWLLQPIRQEQTRRGLLLPVLPVKAPKGKQQFIMQLQPFFKAGEITFDKNLPDLTQQLLNFPTGRIDVPNALAYALQERPGAPVYDGFTGENVVDNLQIAYHAPIWLALNATTQHTTGALVQVIDGGLNVVTDFVREGDPGNALAGIVADAGVVAGRGRCSALAVPAHFERYDTVGLLAGARRVPCDVRPAGQVMDGRARLRTLLQERRKGMPAVKVSSAAVWTLNALAGGFCYTVDKKTGMLSDLPKPGPYQTLMEGIESVAALTQLAQDADDRRYAYSADGRRYLTTRGGEPDGPRPSKSDWGVVLSRR